MDVMLLLIAIVTAGSVGLLAAQAYGRLTLPGRAVAERLSQRPVTTYLGAGSSLRQPLQRRLLVGMLPLSHQAERRIAHELELADWPIRVREYLTLRVLCAAVGVAGGITLTSRLAFPFWIEVLLLGVMLIGGWLVPRALVARRRQRRLQKIEKQLPDAVVAMAKSLRVGSGFLQALAYAADETPAPLGLELRRALRDLQMGAQAEEVFNNLAKRVNSPDFDIVVTAIVIQRTVGGNLSEILMNVNNMIQERGKLRSEVRALTARQRMTSNFMAALPVLVAIAFIVINPDMGRVLIHTVPGQIALAIGALFEVVGIWLIRRLAVIDV